MVVQEVSEKICTRLKQEEHMLFRLALSSFPGPKECRTSSDGGNELFDSDAFLDVRFEDSDKNFI
jgi:hypothetical protein